MIAACDSGRHGIYLINPTNGVISTLTGFNGAGDNANIWENTPNFPVAKANAKFNQPMGLAKAGNGMLIVADYGNNRVKVVNSVGTVTNLYGVSSSSLVHRPGRLARLAGRQCHRAGCPGRCRSAAAQRRAVRRGRHRLCHRRLLPFDPQGDGHEPAPGPAPAAPAARRAHHLDRPHQLRAGCFDLVSVFRRNQLQRKTFS